MFFDEKFLLLKTHNKHMQNKQTKKFIAHVLFFFFFLGGVLHLPACRILIPLSKIESMPLTVKM